MLSSLISRENSWVVSFPFVRPPALQVLWFYNNTSSLYLVFSSSRHPKSSSCVSTSCQVRQKVVHEAVFWIDKMLHTSCGVPATDFLPILQTPSHNEKHHWILAILPCRRGTITDNMFLFSSLCSLLSGFWSSHKGVLIHILLLIQHLCRGMRNGTSCFAILLMFLLFHVFLNAEWYSIIWMHHILSSWISWWTFWIASIFWFLRKWLLQALCIVFFFLMDICFHFST
jgi:hypothetical protein